MYGQFATDAQQATIGHGLGGAFVAQNGKNQGALAEILGDLEGRINSLSESMGCLSAALGPVLTPIPPAPSGTGASTPTPPKAEVLNIIENMGRRITDVTDQIEDVRRRLIV